MGAEQSGNATLDGNQGKQVHQMHALGFRDDTRFGEFKLYQGDDGQLLALITKTCQNYNDYCLLCTRLNRAKELNNIPGMVRLIEVNTQEEGNLCSSFYKVTALYQYYDYTLVNYLQEGHQFHTANFLEQCVATLSSLYSMNVPHGDVSPSNIMVDSTGMFRFNNVQQMTGFNQYKRALIEDDGDKWWYLAPELLTLLKQKELRPHFDQHKADVYSLALVTLEASLGESIQKVFNHATFTVNEYTLEQLLTDFGQKEGALFSNLLKQMLQFDPQMRPSFQDLTQFLPPIVDSLRVASPVKSPIKKNGQVPTSSEVKEAKALKDSANKPSSALKESQKINASPKQQQQQQISLPSNKPSIPVTKSQQSLQQREFYSPGTISSQFSHLHEQSPVQYALHSVTTAQFQDSLDFKSFQKENISADTSARPQKSTVAKAVVSPAKAVVAPAPASSLRRPKREDQNVYRSTKKAQIARRK